MSDEERPLSELVAKGWEVAGFSTTLESGAQTMSFLLRRQRQHKVLVVNKRVFQAGFKVKEIEL